jgi:hypothetical protein
MYRKMLGWIRPLAPTTKVYLCMESREVWQQVFGFAPSCEKTWAANWQILNLN